MQDWKMTEETQTTTTYEQHLGKLPFESTSKDSSQSSQHVRVPLSSHICRIQRSTVWQIWVVFEMASKYAARKETQHPNRCSYRALRLRSAISHQWWKQDQNVKTKTKTNLSNRKTTNRKNSSVATCMFVVKKITWCKKRHKVLASNAWHCFCTYRTKEGMRLLHFSIIVSHSALSVTTVMEARPKV